jgi:integrase
VLPPVSRRVGLALRLALLTGARANEVAGATKMEIQHLDDDGRAVWIIPAERVKNKRPHLVPLSPLARETISAAIELTDDGHDLVFPSPRKPQEPITAHALTVAMSRLMEKLAGNDGAVKSWRADPPSPHDLRRTLATRLAEMGISKEDRDCVLNHVRSDIGTKHYDLYERAKEKRAALDRWSAELTGILSPAAIVSIGVARKRARP